MNSIKLFMPNNSGCISEPRLRESDEETPWRWRALLTVGAVALLSLAACTNPGGQAAPSLEGKPLSGYVDMSQVQAAYIGSGSAGQGTLSYRGQTYPFNVGGLGIGGIGVSTIRAKARFTDYDTSAIFRARTRRSAMALHWATRARAICGCRTRMG